METLFNETNFEEVLAQVIKTHNLSIKGVYKAKNVQKIRFMENGKSYEDFSISYYLDGRQLNNFTVVKVSDECFEIHKKDPKAKRHIKFNPLVGGVIKVSSTKKPYIIVDTVSEIYYTDGTHRYNK